MADPARDHSHLRSGALMTVVPPGKGNTLEGRILREHARMLTDHIERQGIEVTELHRLLIVRLGRMALQITLLERRLDDGGLPENELRQYQNLNNHYVAILRELTLRPPRVRTKPEESSESGESPGPSIYDLLAEMRAGE